ncbi:RNase P and RNase MRP subunit [Neocucurbitaria cava]|uniref:RNase P and RNase MRP subunit n=1 Tax=Neocucurbitaria cava TaxID=798079 RepID=A0A9W8Y1Q9_9PLEO|nr:RNase P and RNase MRP subunit [Neocucurbitaria cava]
MAPTPKQPSKTIFKTSSPFTETKWPELSQDDQDIILDLTCNLIAPLGEHRKTHIHPSKGKKRKRKCKPTENDSTTTEDPPPPAPEIGKHILIGLNSVTRHLEALAAKNAPKTTPVAALKSRGDEPEVKQNKEKEDLRRLSVVILTHPKPSLSPAHAHLPTLVHLSTLSSTAPAPPQSSNLATRLIPLPTSTDARLASKLHIPRVGALGIFEDAPGAEALEAFVREKVGRTECAWIDEAMKAEWRGVNVKSDKS